MEGALGLVRGTAADVVSGSYLAQTEITRLYADTQKSEDWSLKL